MEDVDLGPEEHGQLADEAEKQGDQEEAAYHSRMQFLKQKAADRFNKRHPKSRKRKPRPPKRKFPRPSLPRKKPRRAQPGSATSPPQPPKIPNPALGLPEKAWPPGPSIRTSRGGYEVLCADEKAIRRREDAETAQQLAEAHKQDWQEQPHEKAFQVFKQDNAGPNGEPLYTVHGRNGEEIAKFHHQKQADRRANLHRNACLKKVQTANEAAQHSRNSPSSRRSHRQTPPVVNTPEQRAKWSGETRTWLSACWDCPFCSGRSTPLPRA